MRFVLVPLMVLVPVLASPLGTPAAASNVVRLTTTTPEYCARLSERLASLPGAEADATRSMAEEGRRLCAEGQVRIGIAWLRRAIRAASGLD